MLLLAETELGAYEYEHWTYAYILSFNITTNQISC